MNITWLEIALYDHWSNQPHGIARVTKKLFISAREEGYEYFIYYCLKNKRFMVPKSLEYFDQITTGYKIYDPNVEIDAVPMEDVIGQNDSIIINGAGWGLDNYIEQLIAIKENRSVIIKSVVYDIIAIHSPHFFIESFATLVSNFQKKIIGLSDHIYSISKNTELDVKRYIADPNKTRTYSIIRMGHDFKREQKISLPINKRTVTPGAKERYILSVGTIEARKNHLYLYFLMRKLIIRFGKVCPKLVIIGAVGWMSEATIEFIRRDPIVQGYIDILTDVNDETLDLLYRDAYFTVYPSYYEGYGLPIIESLSRGKLCVTSNTSSMGEINPFSELTFDPYDINQGFEIFGKLIQDESLVDAYECKISLDNFKITWHDTFLDLQISTIK